MTQGIPSSAPLPGSEGSGCKRGTARLGGARRSRVGSIYQWPGTFRSHTQTPMNGTGTTAEKWGFSHLEGEREVPPPGNTHSSPDLPSSSLSFSLVPRNSVPPNPPSSSPDGPSPTKWNQRASSSSPSSGASRCPPVPTRSVGVGTPSSLDAVLNFAPLLRRSFPGLWSRG